MLLDAVRGLDAGPCGGGVECLNAAKMGLMVVVMVVVWC